MEYLLDESGLQKLVHLLADRPSLEFVEAPQALLDRLGVRQDMKGVLGDLPWHARHVRGAPREDVSVGTKKVDEHHFLFAVEGSADLQHLAAEGVGVRGTFLAPSAGLKLPACRCVDSMASFAILSKSAARASSTTRASACSTLSMSHS